MSSAVTAQRLPWSASPEDAQRFRRTQSAVLVPALLLSLVLPLLPLFEIEIPEIPEPPVTITLLPDPPVRLPPPPPEPQGGGQAAEPEPAPRASSPQPAAPARRVETPVPAETAEAARDRASRAGVLAASRELAALRNNPVITSVQSDRQLRSGGTKASTGDSGQVFAGTGQGTGGISTEGIGQGGTGTALGEGGTGRSLGGGGTGGRGAGGTGGGSGGGTGGQGAYQPVRSAESIQLVFDRNRASFDAIYNRALRQNPGMQGVILLDITILPSGKVSDCVVASSELRDPELESKITTRVKLLDFGAEQVPVYRGKYRLSLFPS